jgi:hypothetical protein
VVVRAGEACAANAAVCGPQHDGLRRKVRGYELQLLGDRRHADAAAAAARWAAEGGYGGEQREGDRHGACRGVAVQPRVLWPAFDEVVDSLSHVAPAGVEVAQQGGDVCLEARAHLRRSTLVTQTAHPAHVLAQQTSSMSQVSCIQVVLIASSWTHGHASPGSARSWN